MFVLSLPPSPSTYITIAHCKIIQPIVKNPNLTKPNPVKPNQTKPNQTKPNQTKTNQIKPNQIKPNRTKPNGTLRPHIFYRNEPVCIAGDG